MTIKADSPDDYVSKVPEERREAFSALRKVINDNLPEGFEEGIQYGMIGWYVPHSIYPAGYHCNPKEPLPHISLGSQKNHIGLYMMCIYGSEEAHDAFVAAWKATGHKLDMGKSCVRIKKWDAIPFDVIGAEVAKHSVDSVISFYESVIKR
jgi:hypothetical protein